MRDNFDRTRFAQSVDIGSSEVALKLTCLLQLSKHGACMLARHARCDAKVHESGFGLHVTFPQLGFQVGLECLNFLGRSS
jgi:hypothetical protein